jgi:hypothetical protein
MPPNALTACFTLAKPLTKKLHLCQAPAHQIEMNFESTSTSREFWIRVLMPNGEKSALLYFNVSGMTHRFVSRSKACGHGNWQIVIYRRAYDQSGLHYRLTSVKTLPLNGVGMLRFRIGSDLQPKIDSRQWIEHQLPGVRVDNNVTISKILTPTRNSTPVIPRKISEPNKNESPRLRSLTSSFRVLRKQNTI